MLQLHLRRHQMEVRWRDASGREDTHCFITRQLVLRVGRRVFIGERTDPVLKGKCQGIATGAVEWVELYRDGELVMRTG